MNIGGKRWKILSWKTTTFKKDGKQLDVDIDTDRELEIYIENSYNENISFWMTKEQALELAEFIIEGYKDVQ